MIQVYEEKKVYCEMHYKINVVMHYKINIFQKQQNAYKCIRTFCTFGEPNKVKYNNVIRK